MAEGSKTRSRFRDALRSRDLRLLTVSFVVDGLGSWAYSTVLVVYVFDRTGSTTWIALITGSRWLPGLLLASYGGVLADRYERTRLMIASALLSAVVMTGIAIVVATDGPLILLLTLSAVSAGVASPYRPAAGALNPEVVDETNLTAANALFFALESLNVVLGPAFGALLLVAYEPATAVVINAISFLVAAALVSRVRVRSTGEAAEGDSALKAFVDGVKALSSDRIATALVLYCALDSGIFGASTVLYIPISEQVGSGTDGYGYLLAGMALGGLLAAGLANRLSASHRLAPIIIVGIVCEAVPFAITAAVHAPSLAFVLQVISGAGMVVVDVLAITALQRSTPKGVLGRVLSLLDIAVLASILISSFSFAVVLHRADLRPTLLALGIGFPAIALLGIGPLLRADRVAAAKLRELEPKVALLQVLDLFSGGTRATLERVAEALEEISVPALDIVLREGDAADALFIIVEGEVEVTTAGQFIRTMGPRSYFGEIGVLRGIPRTATVRTVEPCVFWRLSAEEFLTAIETTAASASLVSVSTARLARTHPRLAASEAT